MTIARREHPEASEELEGAVDWYEERVPVLGQQFLDAVRDTVAHLDLFPESAPPYPDWDRLPIVRSKRVDGFPYRVVYFLRDGEMVIVAYAHERREPGYWRHRVHS